MAKVEASDIEKERFDRCLGANKSERNQMKVLAQWRKRDHRISGASFHGGDYLEDHPSGCK